MKYKFSSSLIFYPWVGQYYFKGFHNLKILIMGESHYISKSEHNKKSFTREVVNEWTQNDKFLRYFKIIANCFLNDRNIIFEQYSDFWKYVSFYNYIQSSKIKAPRIRPSKDMWQKSVKSFFNVLSVLNPEFILVTGKALWHNLPDAYDENVIKITKDISIPICRYHNRANSYSVCGYIYHPSSSRFNYENSIRTINALIDYSRSSIK